MRNRIIVALLWVGLSCLSVQADPVTVETGNHSYNCHGFTFHDGAEEGPQSSTEQTIEDHYSSTDDPQPGDIIVYDGELVSHTGLVIGRDENGELLVVSKFGTHGDLKVHHPNEYGDSTTDEDWDVFRPNSGQVTPHPDFLKWRDTFLKARHHNNLDLQQRYGRRLARYLSRLQYLTRQNLERTARRSERGTVSNSRGPQERPSLMSPNGRAQINHY